MSTSKHIDKICIAIIISACLLMVVIIALFNKGIITSETNLGYEDKLFTTDEVHTIDIQMDDWDDFIQNCESEEYATCTVVIDGETFSNIAIRGKGNTSLSNVSSMDSERYSLKLEFDHYKEGYTYYGLDKLCLNNLIQDNTMMKDFLTYQMMREFGVDTPLSSYAYITVNGEDWGLYLAVEGVEDSFLARNYSSQSGNLYKPDSMSFGAGVGNGKDFDINQFKKEDTEGFSLDENKQPPNDFSFDFGKGSDDVKLKYIDDDADSYSNIFDNAKTDVSESDKKTLISALKNLSEYNELEKTLDMEEVLRYFVVHNFVCNGDSYTGNMIHNYYLYEEDGQLSMIPWDYNLAYGTFSGGDASDTVNTSIDEPVSGDVNDRPMVGWIFSDEEYTQMYHELFAEFINEWYESGKMEQLISDTAEMIRPYVESDPTKFCTTDEFDEGVDAIYKFVLYRSEAVLNQLAGDDTKVETNDLDLSAMGTMNVGGEHDGGFGGEFPMEGFGGEPPMGEFGKPGGVPNGDWPQDLGPFNKSNTEKEE